MCILCAACNAFSVCLHVSVCSCSVYNARGVSVVCGMGWLGVVGVGWDCILGRINYKTRKPSIE